MKVLHINFLLEDTCGGVPSAVANIVRSTSGASIQHSVVGGVGGRSCVRNKLHNFYVGAQTVVSFRRSLSPSSFVQFSNWLQMNSRNFDIMHLHGLFNYFSLVASRFCIKNKIPYVVSPHGMLSPYGMSCGAIKKKLWFNLFDYHMIQECTRVHVCSEMERVSVELYHRGADIEVIPLTVSPSNAVNVSCSRASSLQDDQFHRRLRFLFVGRLDPVKNLEFLLRSFAMIDRECYGLTVAGAGSDGYQARLASLANELNISSNVDFLGHVSDVGELYKRHDVLLLPSLSESFGLVAVEAAMAGLRVVVSDRVGVGPTLQDLGAAKIFDLKGESLVSVLMEEIQRTEVKQNEANVAHAVQDFFSASRVGNKFIRLYSSI